MDKTTSVRTPWRDGNWKVKNGGLDIIILAEEKLTSRGSGHSSKLKYGSFGEADPKIVELTGEKYYTLESTYDMIGKEMGKRPAGRLVGQLAGRLARRLGRRLARRLEGRLARRVERRLA